MTTLMQSPAAEIAPRFPVELRSSNLARVNFTQRTIEVIAVPYDEPAPVEYRGEVWSESFAPGSFDGIEQWPNPIRANRDHDKRRTVGKIVNFWPSRQEGLVASVRVARTELGDETLVLADEDCLGASGGFAVTAKGQELNRANRSRRIKTAHLDHLAFVPDPAYVGAGVLSVRGTGVLTATPALDELVAWLNARNVAP